MEFIEALLVWAGISVLVALGTVATCIVGEIIIERLNK